MHSIRTKTTFLTVCAIIIGMTVVTLMAAIAIRNLGNNSANQILYLLCETGEKNLDAYFESVEQSVEIVSGYALEDLAETPLEELDQHLARVESIFEKTAKNTAGILTYYYRIDPEVPTDEKGFWYVDLDGEGFQAHEVTDITLYDTADQSSLVWFTVPKATGGPIWLPPYVTDNLDVYVLSYNVPVYKNGMFIGVIGIEIDYSTMAETVESIELYDNGYAFVNDDEGNIIYHPRISIEELSDHHPKVPNGLLSESTYIRYTYEGVEKQAVWMPLSNGMRLNVTVPVSEINGDWHRLIREIILVSAILLIVFAALTLRLSGHITKPLKELAKVAERVNDGDYEIELDYNKDDEVGLLTHTFKRLVNHLKGYISDLNSLAYGDALTSVRNKSAFDLYMREIQTRLETSDEHPEFAVGMFDCDDLKAINDQYGHDKGDVYLKNTSHLLCRVFQHSPVFRIGGDEFAVILLNEDYRNRDQLAQTFVEKSAEICAFAKAPWEQVHAAMGIAAYEPGEGFSVDGVVRRADLLMYEDKRTRKAGR